MPGFAARQAASPASVRATPSADLRAAATMLRNDWMPPWRSFAISSASRASGMMERKLGHAEWTAAHACRIFSAWSADVMPRSRFTAAASCIPVPALPGASASMSSQREATCSVMALLRLIASWCSCVAAAMLATASASMASVAAATPIATMSRRKAATSAGSCAMTRRAVAARRATWRRVPSCLFFISTCTSHSESKPTRWPSTAAPRPGDTSETSAGCSQSANAALSSACADEESTLPALPSRCASTSAARGCRIGASRSALPVSVG
mmetsp:Transcript_18490/g.70109  ORF Transcript_18490/g.70109 Transcript_18490/m.70109 type:complete len:269 (-) Transcript_18490:603-1409(-)